MGSYILRPEGMTEAEFVERRNAYLYDLWLANNELDREEAARRAKANREKHPHIESFPDGLLAECVKMAHAGVKHAHAEWGGIDSDEARTIIREATEAYFMYRHEHDYRQAQGC